MQDIITGLFEFRYTALFIFETTMKSLPLTARTETTLLRQPKQAFVFARDINGKYVHDEEEVKSKHLSYYYFPDRQIDENHDLLAGFKEFQKIPEEENLGDFDALLRGLIQYEKHTQTKVNADIVAFRGLMTKLLQIPFERKEPVDLNVVSYDGQIFITNDPDIELRRRNQELSGLEPKTAEFRQKCEYSGYKFEQLVTIPTPWVQASRKQITSRHKTPVNNYEQFISVVTSKIGLVRTLLAGEVDCVWNYVPDASSDKKDDILLHYVELKTSKLVQTPGNVLTMERKLFKTWAQCFLLGIKKVVYGFRDDLMILRNVELYETDEIPVFLKNSTVATGTKKINAMSALKWYGAVLEFIKSEVPLDGNGAWKLNYDPGSGTFNLDEIIDPKPVRDRIITAEFREWRESLKNGV